MPQWRVTFEGLLSEADAGALSSIDATPDTPAGVDRVHATVLEAPSAEEAVRAVQRMLVDGPYRFFDVQPLH